MCYYGSVKKVRHARNGVFFYYRNPAWYIAMRLVACLIRKMEAINMEERTLCKRCAQNYRAAGFKLFCKEFQFVHEPCDICSRPGVEYEVIKRSGGDRIEHG